MPRLCLGLARNHHGDTSCSVDDQLRKQPLFDPIVYMGTDASAYPPQMSAFPAFDGTCTVACGERPLPGPEAGSELPIATPLDHRPEFSQAVEARLNTERLLAHERESLLQCGRAGARFRLDLASSWSQTI